MTPQKNDRERNARAPRKPGPEDADVPPEQQPVKQAKNPKQPPREEKAATERPHPGRHHPPRDGL
ncbi:MAG: hypothetical protein ACREMD_05590 [Gemmatimonadota bacterium]